MKHIKITNLKYENFKGIQNFELSLSDITTIQGRNASGKTTVLDGFLWLLFGKDSTGRTDFQIRPVDAEGKLVDNVEIKVSATLSEMGDEWAEEKVTTLTKVQKQVWTKKRGSDAKTFQGNTNSFEINGFPASQKEYAAKVASLVDESLFRILTDPRAFAALPWKDQREILLLFGEVEDEELLSDPKYDPIREDVLAAGVDKSALKAKGILKELKDAQKTYPVRIDEAERAIHRELNEQTILTKKAELEAQLKGIQTERDDLSAGLSSVNELQNKIISIKLDMSNVERAESEKTMSARYELQKAIDECSMEIRSITGKYNRAGDALMAARQTVDADNAERQKLVELYKAEANKTMDASQTICPTCGREYEPDKVDQIRKAFEDTKRATLEKISIKGKALKAAIDEAEPSIKKMENERGYLQHEFAKKQEELTGLKEKLGALPESADMENCKAYRSLKLQMEALQAQLALMDNGDERRKALQDREDEIRTAMMSVDAQLAMVEASKIAMERVEELRAEQLSCGQKVAYQEQIVFLLEEFSKEKMSLLSEKINSRFSKVRFKLFETQINGGVKETCVMQVNSNGSYVDYTDANHAAQLLGGLDVIDALSNLYGVSVPVWIDNSESIDSFNTPKTKSQLIMLSVSDDPELVVWTE